MLISVKGTQKNEDGTSVPREVTLEKDFGGDLAGAIKEHGEEIVFTYFQQQAVIRTQAVVRSALASGEPDQVAIDKGEAYKLGEITRQAGGGGGIKKAVDLVKSGKMSKEELIAIITASLEEDEQAEAAG